MKPLIIPVPFAKSEYGTTADTTYEKILSISSANETMLGKNESNILLKNCEVSERVNFENYGEYSSETPFIREAISMQTNLAGRITQDFDVTRKYLVLGGDHTISIGTGLGLSQNLDMKKVGLLYIDQHGDCNTPQTSSSKCLTGYPVAVVCGHGDKELTRSFAGNFIQKVAYVGVRDIDEPEMEIFNQLDKTSFSTIDVEINGIAKCIEKSLEFLGECDYIWLSIDVDCLDSIYFEKNETDVPAPAGLTPRELLTAAYLVEKSGKLLITEITQLNDVGGITDLTVLASRISETVLGLGKFRYGYNTK